MSNDAFTMDAFAMLERTSISYSEACEMRCEAKFLIDEDSCQCVPQVW